MSTGELVGRNMISENNETNLFLLKYYCVKI